MKKPAGYQERLQAEIEHIVRDAERFLSDLKGHRHAKGLVKKDVRLLKDHVYTLIDHLKGLEERYTV